MPLELLSDDVVQLERYGSSRKPFGPRCGAAEPAVIERQFQRRKQYLAPPGGR